MLLQSVATSWPFDDVPLQPQLALPKRLRGSDTSLLGNDSMSDCTAVAKRRNAHARVACLRRLRWEHQRPFSAVTNERIQNPQLRIAR